MALINVVKYDGSPHMLVWKHPNSELGTWTQLIVNESQEAVLFKGGQALDLFAAGRHTLSTNNIPILSAFMKIPFGGKSPFSAEVWYANKLNTLDVKWGTPTPIQLQDPKYNIFMPVRAHGQFGLRIEDTKMFLTKLVGTLPFFTTDEIVKYFKGIYLTKAKDLISEYLVNEKVSVMEINAYIDDISENLKGKINPAFEEHGMSLLNFQVNDISVPEDDTAVMKLKDALAKKAEMDIVGYSYAQERTFDTLGAAASNQGSESASLMGTGMGLGMGVGMGNIMGGAMGGMAGVVGAGMGEAGMGAIGVVPATTQQNVPAISCPKCGSQNQTDKKFCAQCGTPLRKTCPKCGVVLEDVQKFCPECGNPLVNKCNCGAELSEGQKFCPECGKPVEG
jgi:membrane protease subunit (stomatin/prohibitin family)